MVRAALEVVDQLQVCPNYCKLPDSFAFTSIKKSGDNQHVENIKNLYLKDGLSSREIASRLDISKSTVLKRLQELGISRTSKVTQGTAPFGFKYHGGKIVISTAESKICREISKLRKKGLSYRKIVEVFQEKQFKRRSGSTKWDHDSIRKIYNNWTKYNEEKKK